jgi:hypothetical protein
MLARLAALGIGSYYALYYCCYLAALATAALAVLLARRRPFRGDRVVAWLGVILFIRLVLFDNPIILKYYQGHLSPEAVGVRQWGVLDLEIGKYSRAFHQPRLANMAVGSSQVGAIFSHWVSDRPQPLKVYSLAGMKTLDLVLYEDAIAAYNPARVILYLSAFDLAAAPELYSLPLAPSRPSEIVSLPLRLGALGVDLGENSAAIHSFIASQLFPEYRFSFIFKGFLKELVRDRSADRPVAVQPIEAPAVVPAVFFDRPGVPVAIRTLHVTHTLTAVSSPTEAAVSPARISEFVGYYLPEWLDYNYAFLRDFVTFCRSRGIQVVIAEGQINPIVNSPKVNALNQAVNRRFAELDGEFSNVTFIPAAEIYQFVSSEYSDLTHVERPAAMAYTRRLSAYLSAHERSGPCTARFLSGWHALEKSAADWLRWSDGTGQLRIASNEPADLVLEGEVLSLVRPNTIDVIIDGRRVTTWRIDDPSWTSHPFQPLPFHADAGKAVTIQLVGHAGPVTQATDPRPLTIAVRNLTLRRTDRSTPCQVDD